jgi:CO/xanthine dehydrogenase Mo-binding subunit
MFSQIVAEQLGVSPSDIIVVEGDTRAFDLGGGTYASRSAVVAGNAVYQAAISLKEQIRQTAAKIWQVPAKDIVLNKGHVCLGDGSLSMPLAAVATSANPLRYAFSTAAKVATQFVNNSNDGPALSKNQHPGIESCAFFSPPRATWGYGAHAVMIEVDPQTGHVEFLRYICLHDCGRMMNKDTVCGQVLGGIAQGIGGALYESLGIDENGEVRNASFSQFLMPFAADLPSVELHHLETPSPLNPLGTKGVGEAGCIPVSAAIASAIDDALSPLNAKSVRYSPMRPPDIYRLIQGD